MALNFADLKKNRKALFEKVNAEVTKLNNPTDRSKDERFWSPTCDKAGNGYAVLRFLPPPAGEEMPYVRMWDHGFQGPNGQWYIEKSLTSIGKDDPVGLLNSKLWNTGLDSDKEVARKQKRRLHFISNIMVVNDTGNPDNNGKVFLYKYGKKIFDKLNELMNPQFQDETQVNPFDAWEGANFKLKIRMVEGYRNYDKSEFDKQSPISKDDDEIESIWKQTHSLQEFIDPKNYKSFEELETKLNKVLGTDGSPSSARANASRKAADVTVDSLPEVQAPKAKAVAESDGEDSDLDYFKQLAGDD